MFSNAVITAEKGSRTSPEKLKPLPSKFRVWKGQKYGKLRETSKGIRGIGGMLQTEDSVDNMVRAFQIRFEVFRERNIEVLELGGKTLKDEMFFVLEKGGFGGMKES